MTLRSDPDKTRKWQRDSRKRYLAKRRRSQKERRVWIARVAQAAADAGYRCQAEGLHSPNCTGMVPRWSGHGHHVHPKSWGGTDDTSEVLWVHPDCHAYIHSHPALATLRGYLTRGRD